MKKRGDSDEVVPRDLLITGHEDGSVRFWNAGSVVLSLMYTFKTNAIFIADDELDEPAESHAEEEEEEWPPFRKVRKLRQDYCRFTFCYTFSCTRNEYENYFSLNIWKVELDFFQMRNIGYSYGTSCIHIKVNTRLS